MGREGVTGLGLSPKKYHFLSFQGDCGHLDREHHPCRAHGDPLQSVCTYQQIIQFGQVVAAIFATDCFMC